MPKTARSGQDWILDRFIGTLGVNALMPGFMTFMASPVVGFNNADLDYIGARTKGVASMRETYRKALLLRIPGVWLRAIHGARRPKPLEERLAQQVSGLFR
jgi:hypothetical protein